MLSSNDFVYFLQIIEIVQVAKSPPAAFSFIVILEKKMKNSYLARI